MLKVGDRVAYNWGAVQDYGIICAIDEHDLDGLPYGIVFDEPVGLNTLGGRCKMGHGLWCSPVDIRKVLTNIR